MKKLKSKVAVVPKWESSEKKRLKFQIRVCEMHMRHCKDRRERERYENQIEDLQSSLGKL